MKRDLNLCRNFLLLLENHPDADLPVENSTLWEFRAKHNINLSSFRWHVDLMIEQGWVITRINVTGDVVYTLGWNGCEALEYMRNEEAWEKAMRVPVPTWDAIQSVLYDEMWAAVDGDK